MAQGVAGTGPNAGRKRSSTGTSRTRSTTARSRSNNNGGNQQPLQQLQQLHQDVGEMQNRFTTELGQLQMTIHNITTKWAEQAQQGSQAGSQTLVSPSTASPARSRARKTA